MSHSEPNPDLELLLGHAQFVRNLARRLVYDESQAEDVEQQTWLAALQNPPRRAARGWFRAVSSNFARRAGRETRRRRRREEAVAANERLPSTADLVAKQAALRQVVDAVLDLPEDSREVVLLRFYEDLPPRLIAERLGLPTTTVQSRLQRGLERLRGTLDSRNGGDDRAWRLGLVALVGLRDGGSSVTTPVGAVAAMCGAAVTLLILAAVWWAVRDDESTGLVPATAAIDERVTEARRASTPEAPPSAPSTRAVSTPARRRVTPALEGPTLRGRVIDLDRFAAAGAVVTVRSRGGRVWETSCDEHGCFTAILDGDLSSVRELSAHVTTGHGLAALRGVPLPSGSLDSIDLETISLTAAHPLIVRVTRDDSPVAGARVALRAVDLVRREVLVPERGDVFLLEGETNGLGELVLSEVPAWDYVARVRGEAGLQASETVAVGPDRQSLHLPLTRGRDLDLHVVSAETGEPVPGARVEVRERLGRRARSKANRIDGVWPATDDRGRVRLAGLPPDRPLRLEVMARGFTPRDPRQAAVDVPSTVRELRVEMSRCRRCRFEPDDPDDLTVGDPVRVVLRDSLRAVGAGCRGDVIEDEAGEPVLEIVDLPRGTRYAALFTHDGRAARVEIPRRGDEGDFLDLFDARFIDVEVLDHSGRPATDILLEALDAGPGPRLFRRARTDRDGRARLGPFVDGVVSVHVGAIRTIDRLGLLAGQVDLDAADGDTPLSVTLPRPREVVVDCTVDGVPGLPAIYHCIVGQGYRSAIAEEPEQHRLRFFVWPRTEGGRTHIALIGEGMTVSEHRVSTDATEPAGIAAAFRTTGRVRIRLETPPDVEDAVTLERWIAGREWWMRVGTAQRRITADGDILFERLHPGRFRVLDESTGITDVPFSLAPGSGEIVRVFDRLQTRWLRIDVDLADAAEIGDARVIVEDRGRVLRPSLHARDGEWFVRVPAHRALVVKLSHPRFTAIGGGVEVGARAPVATFRLDVGRTLAFELPWGGDSARGGRIALLRPRTDEAVAVHPLSPRGDVLHAAGLPAGRFDLWCDVPGWAPFFVDDVAFGDAPTELGRLDGSRGARVRIVVQPRNGVIPPVRVRVDHRGRLHYRRAGSSRAGAREVLVGGLAPGAFTVTVTPTAPVFGFSMREWRIEITGEDDEITLSY